MATNQDNFADTSKIDELQNSEVTDSTLQNLSYNNSLDLTAASSSGYVDMGSVLSTDDLALTNPSGFAIMMRVYLRTGGTYSQRIISKATGGVGAGGYAVLIDDSGTNTSIFIGANGSFVNETFANTVLPQNAWFYLGVSCDGTNAYYYVNGVLAATDSFTSLPPATTAPLIIGERATLGDRNAYVKLQNICMYDAPMSASDFLKHAQGSPSYNDLVERWRCETGSGVTLFGDFGVDGTLMETATWDAELVRFSTQSRTTSINLLDGI